MLLRTNARFVFPANRDGSLGVRKVRVPRGAPSVLWPFHRFYSDRHSSFHRSLRAPTLRIERTDFQLSRDLYGTGTGSSIIHKRAIRLTAAPDIARDQGRRRIVN